MERTMLLTAYRFGFGALTVVAVVTQAAELAGRDVLVPINFLSYFTIQSNLIAVAVFFLGATRFRADSGATWDIVRGASVLNMTVTFVVFALLLADTDVDTALPWVNAVVHTIMPLAVIADWLIDPPRQSITLRTSMAWLAFPLAWTVYTLIRGEIAGWYPYPFLDPANGGYATVALYVVAILVFGVVLCTLISTVGNRLGEGRRQSAAG